MTNSVTKDRRHFEDLETGEVIPLGPVTVTREMIISFAEQFDPLPFHLDEGAANRSLLGGLAASGWQTCALSLRMLVDSFLGKAASLGGLGFSDLKWKRPLFAGDDLSGTATVAELRRSGSRPDWGIVQIHFDMRNQNGEPVMSMNLANLIEVRKPGVTQ